MPGQLQHVIACRARQPVSPLLLLLLLLLLFQSSSGAASTLERLTKETDANISQVHADVAAKKNLVSVDCNTAVIEQVGGACYPLGSSVHGNAGNSRKRQHAPTRSMTGMLSLYTFSGCWQISLQNTICHAASLLLCNVRSHYQ
jgi:hypothetical protein